jgi:hypothetical protein
VTVYNEGLNTTNWLVTANSATGTQNVLHCGPGWAIENSLTTGSGSVCVATYPAGTTVTLTASQQPTGTTSTFGGWSTNCGTYNAGVYTPNLTLTCTLTVNSSETVGVIFN